jgi:hypothetical protein
MAVTIRSGRRGANSAGFRTSYSARLGLSVTSIGLSPEPDGPVRMFPPQIRRPVASRTSLLRHSAGLPTMVHVTAPQAHNELKILMMGLRSGDDWRIVRYAGDMRYPDGGCLTADLLDGFLASTGLDLTPFRNPTIMILSSMLWRLPINLDSAGPGGEDLQVVSSGDTTDDLLRDNLIERIPGYVKEAISADEFDSIDYYNLDYNEIESAVIAQLHELLPTVQLGTFAELRDRAKVESAQKPTLRSALSPWILVLFLSVLLLLLGGTVLSVLLGSSTVQIALLFVLLAIVGGYAIRRGQGLRRQFNDAQRRSASAWRRYDEAVIEQMVSPVIREVINDRLNHYDSQLTVQRSPGLMTDDPLFWIDTDNSRRLVGLMKVMPDGGSIGLAGPRGCGKTTLLKELCAAELALPGGRVPEAVLVTVPVEFASRDFLLHLFARICEQSLGYAPFGGSPLPAESPDAVKDGRRPGLIKRRPGLIRRHPGKAALLGILCLIASPFVAYAALPAAQQRVIWHWLRVQLAVLFGKNQHQVFADTGQVWHFLHLLDRRLAVISVILFLAGLILLLVVTMRFLVPRSKDMTIEELARRHLRNIKFQQSYSYGWSGSLTVPMAQVGINEAFSVAEYQKSLPDIVATMREFLELIATESSPVVIAVDELDKLGSDVTAAQFLNDLKGIFGVRHCFYLVSVSEEALSNFELRGFPFRDAFDSAFDEVLHLRPLPYLESKGLLQRRVVGLSAAYLCLCQCLAGGLPRDLVRVARDIVETGRKEGGAARQLGMCDVVAALVQVDLQGRTDATMIAIRRVSAELEIEPMALWINQISGCLAAWRTASDSDVGVPTSELRAKQLQELYSSYPAAVYDVRPTAAEAGGAQGAASTMSRLGLGLAGSLYYLATVIELFRDDRTTTEFQELDESVADMMNGRQIGCLVRARQAFAISPMIAWKQISDFRASWGMSVLDSPGRGRRPDSRRAGRSGHSTAARLAKGPAAAGRRPAPPINDPAARSSHRGA